MTVIDRTIVLSDSLKIIHEGDPIILLLATSILVHPSPEFQPVSLYTITVALSRVRIRFKTIALGGLKIILTTVRSNLIHIRSSCILKSYIDLPPFDSDHFETGLLILITIKQR